MENKEKKIKVGMVQINNSFDRQNYLPLSLGFLHSYAKKHAGNFGDFEFLMPIYKRISIERAVEHLSESDIVAFSTYVWNFNISSEIAKRLKKEKPETLIVFGGCHVPEPNINRVPYIEGKDERYEDYIRGGGIGNLEKTNIPNPKGPNKETTLYSCYDNERDKGLESFLRKNNFIDIAATGEGEIVFTSILENYPKREWGGVPSVHYLEESGKLISTFPTPRIEDLNEIPSPFLEGYFDSLIEENKEEKWIALFETNRGCPFGCTFCDWGINAKNRMANYNLEERIFKEIDWLSEKQIEFVFCCDANFGIYATEKFDLRDIRIAERFAENKKKHGYPHRFSVQNTKNSTEASYKIQKVLNDSGLDKGVLLAFQSLHKPTLEAIDRGNIRLETYHELQKRFTKEGVTTFSDIILGLPLETYETFTNGVSTLIENGQHNRIQFNNLSVLPNAPMVEDIEKYGLEMVESDMINIHGSLGEWTDNIYERQQLVVGTSTMPREDWAKARNFSYMISLLHFDKVLQVPNVLLNTQYGVSYKEITDTFIDNSLKMPVIGEISDLFSEQARNLQKGGAEYIHSEEWLNIWWPADEYALIKLATEGKLNAFYREAEETLFYILSKKGYSNHRHILSEAISFNENLLKMPFQNIDSIVGMNYNIFETYRAGLVSEKTNVREGDFSYLIDKKAHIDRNVRKPNGDFKIINSWDSWEDWCREVVWYGNKKGDYIYSCFTLKERLPIKV